MWPPTHDRTRAGLPPKLAHAATAAVPPLPFDNRMLLYIYDTDYHVSLLPSCFADSLPVTHYNSPENFRKSDRDCY
jgi:hypothetical protein